MTKRGRPTKYGPKILKKVQEYIEKCKDDEYIFQKMSGKTDGFEEKIRTHLPTLAGLALYLGIDKDTVQEWGKEKPEFSVSLSRIKQMQEQILIDNGLSNRYNPLIAKLILSSNHGYREGKDITSNGNTLPTPILSLNVPSNNSNGEDSEPQ